MEGTLASLCALGTLMIYLTKSDYFSGTIGGLSNFSYICDSSSSVLGNFLSTGTTFVLMVDLSGVTQFDDLYIEELQHIPSDENLISIGV